MGDAERPEAAFLEKLRRLRQHSYAGRRAPHKPLLILYALARLKQRGAGRVRYREAKQHVEPLLHKYGPPGTRARVADPFARLEGDGIWSLFSNEREALFDAGGNARPGALERHDPEAGFDDATLGLLRRRPALIDEAATQLLEANFPPEAHEVILREVGLRADAQ